MDWLDELEQMRQADEEAHRAKTEELDLGMAAIKKAQANAADVLRHSEAHKLLRRVQNVLLGGKGMIDIFDSTEDYDKAIALVWQGPISKARIPNPEDPEPYKYILVGAKGSHLYVNGKQLDQITPEALKPALVWAAKNPLTQTPQKKKKG